MPTTPRRTRRRSGFRAGVVVAMCLAFGAATNLGVAWWCVWGYERQLRRVGGAQRWTVQPSPGVLTPSRIAKLPKRWPIEVPSDWPAPEVVWGAEFGWVYWTEATGSPAPPAPPVRCFVSLVEIGWPMRCFWGADPWVAAASARTSGTAGSVRFADVPPAMRELLGVSRLPIGIHPLPFIANTLVYAAIPGVPWVVWGPLRRWRRRRGGRCVMCGYDRAGLAAGAACPECGEGSR